jgi:aspartate kinase
LAKLNPQTLIVQKFGGTSLGTPERIRQVARRITEEKRAGRDVIVVVSAMGNTTDHLFRLARTVTPSPPKRELDMLLTAGERVSMALLSMAISDLGFEAISFTGSQSGIVTDTSHTKARILDVRAYRVQQELERGRIVIVAGFQGVSPAKEVTTLGRGGSDTTCVALASAFGARQCDIFTDVDGIYTADPHLVPEARKIEKISYDEMIELAFCGAGVLHWRSVDVAKRSGVRVHVRSSFRKETGTIVTDKGEIEIADVRGMTHDFDLVRISVPGTDDAVGLAAQMLEALENADINVRLLNISPASGDKGNVSVMVSKEQKDSALRALKDEVPDREFTVDEEVATISIVGHGLCAKPGIAKTVLASLASLGIRPLPISTSGTTLTISLRQSEAVEAMRQLHRALGLSGNDAS